MVINVHIDGASRNNPGNAGAGVVIEAGAGVVLAELKEYLGIATNNEAEYRALIIALNYLNKVSKKFRITVPAPASSARSGAQTAISGDINKITFFSDSQLLIKQMNGEYAVKSPKILPLYADAKKILKSMGLTVGSAHPGYSFIYIPREFNKQADRLANLAIDEALAL